MKAQNTFESALDADNINGPAISTGNMKIHQSKPVFSPAVNGPNGELTIRAEFLDQQYNNNITTTQDDDFGLMFGAVPTAEQSRKLYLRENTMKFVNTIGSPEATYYDASGNGDTFEIQNIYSFNILANNEGLNMDNLDGNPATDKPTNGTHYLGKVKFTFSKPVDNPIMHVTGIGGLWQAGPLYPTGQYELLFNAVLEAEVYSLEMLKATQYTEFTNNNTISNKFTYTDFMVNGATGLTGSERESAATGSFRVLGENITELILKISMKGKPHFKDGKPIVNHTLWSNEDNGADASYTGTPERPKFYEGKNFYTGDQFNVSFTFPSYTITGSAIEDPKIDGVVEGDNYLPKANEMYANLVDEQNKVILSNPIGIDGNFTFEKVLGDKYHVQVSTAPLTLGSLAPNTGTLSSGLIPTGQAFGVDNTADLNRGDVKTDQLLLSYQNTTPTVKPVLLFGMADYCIVPATTTGTPSVTEVGISTLERNTDNWIKDSKNGFIHLESKSYGFVPTRLTQTQINNIQSPVEGMMVWNTTAECMMLYKGAAEGWSCVAKGCNK